MSIVTWDSVNIGNGAVLSNGNLTAKVTSFMHTVRATEAKSSGKWYWEVKVNQTDISGVYLGIVNNSAPLSQRNENTTNARLLQSNGSRNLDLGNIGKSYTTGDTISILLDMDKGTLEFLKNGTTMGITHTDLLTMGEVYPALTGGTSIYGNTSTANFGATEFNYKIPNGYRSYDDSQPTVNKVLIQLGDKKYMSLLNDGSDLNLVPKMTSATVPSGKASSSSTYSTNVSYDAWKAFSGTMLSDSYDNWVSASGKTGWLNYEFENPTLVNTYTLSPRNYSDASTTAPKDWKIEGSNDGVNYIVLDAVNGETNWKQEEIRKYDFKNNTPYKHIRINVSDINGGSFITIGHFGMYYDSSQILEMTLSEQNFINHGMDDLSGLDPKGKLNSKRYINQTSIPLGDGKIFTQPLDLEKYEIHKIRFK